MVVILIITSSISTTAVGISLYTLKTCALPQKGTSLFGCAENDCAGHKLSVIFSQSVSSAYKALFD